MSNSPTMPDMSQPGAQATPASQAPPPGPHSRLLAMVQGLAVGVGAFAHSAATQGREGGPADVEKFQQQQQEEQLRSQQSQIAGQTAQREQQEGDLRMQAMRGQMAVNQFQLEQMRMRAPLEIKKAQNDVAEQELTFKEHISKITGLPLMVIESMTGDGTGKTVQAMNDTAQQNGTTIHDATWTHVQNDGAPGNGSKIVGLDLAKFGGTVIPADSASLALNPVKTQISVGEGVLGADAPEVKGAKQALETLQTGLASGQMTVQQYSLLANRITTPIANAMGVKHATLDAQKQQAETTEAQQKAVNETPAGAGVLAGAKAKAEQPYQVSLKQMEAPIAAGVADNKDARDKVESSYIKPFTDKLNAAQELVSSLAQAEQGNSAASKAALFKMVGITQPTNNKRVSPEALRDIEKQGNIPEQFVSKIKDALTGDRWTSQMSQDMKDFAKAQVDVAKSTLRSGIKQTNALYDTKIDAEKVIGAAAPLDVADAPGGSLADKWTKVVKKAIATPAP
jgi:hypothetical protein